MTSRRRSTASPFTVHHVRPVPGAPPVVLLHGVYADHHLWDPVLPLLGGLDLLPRPTVPVALVAGVDDYVGSSEEQAHVRAAGFTLDLHPGGHTGPREAPAHLARRLRALVPAHRPLTVGDR